MVTVRTVRVFLFTKTARAPLRRGDPSLRRICVRSTICLFTVRALALDPDLDICAAMRHNSICTDAFTKCAAANRGADRGKRSQDPRSAKDRLPASLWPADHAGRGDCSGRGYAYRTQRGLGRWAGIRPGGCFRDREYRGSGRDSRAGRADHQLVRAIQCRSSPHSGRQSGGGCRPPGGQFHPPRRVSGVERLLPAGSRKSLAVAEDECGASADRKGASRVGGQTRAAGTPWLRVRADRHHRRQGAQG